MGRRLLLMLALAVVIGFLVRLAPAQDAPPPRDEPAALPPVAEIPAPAPVAPPRSGDGAVMPPSKKDGEKATPPTDAGGGPNAPRPTGQAPAAAGAPGQAVPDGQLGGAPMVPGPPAAPATPAGNLVDGSFDPPAGPVAEPGPVGEPAPRPAVPARDAAVEQSQAAVPAAPVNPEGTNPLPPATPPPGQPDAGAAATESDEFVLPPERLQMGRQSVGLTLEVLGPAALNLNTVATYRIVVRNGGTADATDVIVRDKLPEGLEFESSQPAEQRGPDSILFWRLGTIPGGDDRTIVVKVKPTKVGQLDHGATVTMRAGAKTRTQVFEPRLKVEQQSTSGQVLKGQPVRFDIVVTNVGNGPARKVKVTAQLSPGLRADSAEADDQNTFVLDLGDLAPGQRAELETLGADTIKGGQQSCKVTATSTDVAAGDPAGTNTQTVTVIEPQLIMNLTGPVKRYTNTVATYTITLENPGTATARNVRVLATLPIGGKLRRTPPNARFDPGTRRLRWDPIQLEPSSQSKEKTQLTFDVAMNGPGMYQVTAEAIAELTKKETKVVSTDVAPLADLEIELTEDRRVVDVGELTRMEVKVTNRGSKDAAHLIISGRLTSNLKLKRTFGNETEAVVKPEKPTEFMFPEIARLPKGESLILGLEVQAINVGNAGCDIYLNHEDDLPHRDYAGFRVTAPTTGP